LERRSDRRRGLLAFVVPLLALTSASAGAQPEGTMFERLNLDRLRLTALGAAYGVVQPTQTERTSLYSVFADYGEIVPRWRVVFAATYWQSRLTDKVVRAFADSARGIVTDPSGDDVVGVPRITVSDVALALDLRWSPVRVAPFRPYLGGGVVVHVINAEGKPIDGTFVERALDSITGGLAGLGGLDIVLPGHFIVSGNVRYDLLSGFRSASGRVGLSYQFETTTRPAP
jgi:hypothetical protein